MSLGNKIILLLLCVTVIPLFLIGTILFFVERQAAFDRSFALMEERAERQTGSIISSPSKTEILARTASDYGYLGDTGETMVLMQRPDGHLGVLVPPRFAADSKQPELDNMLLGVERSLSANEHRMRLEDYRGQEVVAVARPVPEAGVVLLIKIDLAAVLIQSNNFQSYLLLGSFIILLATVFIGLIVSKSLIDPIRFLTISVSKFSESPTAELPQLPQTKDEIGNLSLHFNDMAKKVSERTQELNDKIHELERTMKVMIGRELKMVELKEELRRKENKQPSNE